jgi:hypothetical protein
MKGPPKREVVVALPAQVGLAFVKTADWPGAMFYVETVS